MKDFYYKADFNFSNDARNWIINRYTDCFNNKFFHDLDITQHNKQKQTEWQNSKAGKELVEFLSLYHCDISYYGIGVFISNSDITVKTNPHIDAKFFQGSSYRIKSRFNVMVLGNPEDKMIWWDHIEYNDKRLIESKFHTIAGQEYISKAIPGNNSIDRWNYLGDPTVQVANLLTPSAFVRTDCAHGLILSPVPRLIVTVALDKSLSEINKILDFQ